MRIGLVLTNDWELYGDGSGDFFSVQHEPMARLLRACERHGAKVTCMAEAGQQWAHEALAEKADWASDIADAWKGQIRDIMRGGNDVQLHLHPQWVGARHDGQWELDFSKYALTALTPSERVDLLVKGRNYLEGLLRPEFPEYRCLAFRAGGFVTEPQSDYVAALRSAGFACDTSVAKGLHHATEMGAYDYRNAPGRIEPWWIGRTLVDIGGQDGDLMEIPLPTETYVDSPLSRKLKQTLSIGANVIDQGSSAVAFAKRNLGLTRKDFERHAAVVAQRLRKYRSGDILTSRGDARPVWQRLASKLLHRSTVTLDYDRLIPKVAAAMVIQLYNSLGSQSDGRTIPVVAIGHAKNLVSDEYVDEFLSLVGVHLAGRIDFFTLSQAYSIWSGRNEPLLDQSTRN